MISTYFDTTKRHILSLSGGKDSSALAIYLKGKVPNIEYVFCDTRKELPETYEYLDKLEVFLGQLIVRLVFEGGDFDDLLNYRNGYLPSAKVRWCTEQLKLKPYEEYIGNDDVFSYVGIRADEPSRAGYLSTKPNIHPVYPFVTDGIVKADVLRILEESGLGYPEYYKWRSRSGCYFCFFQQRIEWVGLKENHPDLFEKAKKYERFNPETQEWFTWSHSESLVELEQPERIEQIKKEHQRRMEQESERKKGKFLTQILDDEGNDQSCLICHL